MKKQNFLLGTAILIISSFFAKIIGAIYRIPLTNILGAEGLGLYQLVFPLYSTILVFCSTGVPNAIAKMVATGTKEDIKKTMKLSLLFFGILSLIFALILFCLAKPLSQLQGNENIWLCYVGIAPAIFFVGIISVLRGYFQGKQNMLPTALSNIVEQLFKLLFGLLFAKLLIAKSVVFGAFGAVLGVTLSELFALFVILFEYILHKKKEKNIYLNESKVNLTSLLSTAMPMTLSSLIMPATLLIDSFLIINLLKSINFSTQLSTNLYGILTGVVNSLINLPVVISMAVATMLIPIISKHYKENNIYQVENKSNVALRLILTIIIPCIAIYFLFSNDIINFLFSNGLKVGEINEFAVASNMLKVASISILFISIVQITTTLLQAVNQTKVPVYHMLVSCSIKVLLTIVLVLIPELNIYGAVISTLVCYIICALLNFKTLLNHIKIKISFRNDILVPSISSIMAVTTMYLVKYLLGQALLTVPFMMLSGIIIYCFVYALMTYGELYNFNDIILIFKKYKDNSK